MTATAAILLAAGKGTRMRSTLPKVLHPFRGEPLLLHPLRAVRRAGATLVVVVVGHGAQAVEQAVRAHGRDGDPELRFAVQAEQRGTGHAVLCALSCMDDVQGPVLVCSGDVPLVTPERLQALVDGCLVSGTVALGVFTPADPSGYGRIVRDPAGHVQAIREHRDADARELAIRECNAGLYCFDAAVLRETLPRVGSNNVQGEIYLTDVIAALAGRGLATVAIPEHEAAGINTPEELSALEAIALGR
ncbi:MAG: NTP transferase domain-containing protein [Deltaproteobacteria bacterium]|nr:NTP transferase domain-containing protein [Deltaproteobacteria bacterium]MBK8720318.1 NTP transferase domain-containing protein [Deltaproteobacteria bacterium]MBP7291076.1 NTP transferase domain-containing protein [Nannocystaceae bacterium]